MKRNITLATLALTYYVLGFRDASRCVSQLADRHDAADLYLDAPDVAELLKPSGSSVMELHVAEGCFPSVFDGLLRTNHVILSQFRADELSSMAYFMLTLRARNGDPTFLTSMPESRREHRHDDLAHRLTGAYILLGQKVDVRAVLAARGVHLR